MTGSELSYIQFVSIFKYSRNSKSNLIRRFFDLIRWRSPSGCHSCPERPRAQRGCSAATNFLAGPVSGRTQWAQKPRSREPAPHCRTRAGGARPGPGEGSDAAEPLPRPPGEQLRACACTCVCVRVRATCRPQCEHPTARSATAQHLAPEMASLYGQRPGRRGCRKRGRGLPPSTRLPAGREAAAGGWKSRAPPLGPTSARREACSGPSDPSPGAGWDPASGRRCHGGAGGGGRRE